MPITLDSITTGATRKPYRGILLGVEKIGKSTFAAGAESPIFLPIRNEEGIDEIDVPKFPAATSYAEILDVIGVLYREHRAKNHNFKTLVIDSASAMAPIVNAHAMKLDGVTSYSKLSGGYGRQDDIPCDLWREVCEGLTALRDECGMNTILIGHVKVKPFNDPLTDPYDTWDWDIQAAVKNLLFRWCDWIWFANRKVMTRKVEAGPKERGRASGTDERKLFTQKRPSHPGGGRGTWGSLPAELPLSWSAVNDALAKLTPTNSQA